MDPFTWIGASLASRAPLLALTVILLLLFWGALFGPLRRLCLSLSRSARRALAPAGTSLCAACGSALAASSMEKLACEACGRCGGKWLAESALSQALAAKGVEPRPWLLIDIKAGLPCPRCADSMPLGRIKGEDFAVYRCAACRGLWFGRVEWISLGLRVLA